MSVIFCLRLIFREYFFLPCLKVHDHGFDRIEKEPLEAKTLVFGLNEFLGRSEFM